MSLPRHPRGGPPPRETGSGHGSHPTAQLRDRGRSSLFLSSWGCAHRCGLCKRREPCVTVPQPAGTAVGVGGCGGPQASVHPAASVHLPRLSLLPAPSLDVGFFFFFLAFRAVKLVLWCLVAVCSWLEPGKAIAGLRTSQPGCELNWEG